ncbi:MAG: DUF899 family protein, partial [Pseudomonadota bacterium]
LEPAVIDCQDDPAKETRLMGDYIKAKDLTWTIAFSEEKIFNPDYGVGLSEKQQGEGYEYNFRKNPAMSRSIPDAPNQFAKASGVDGRTYLRELPGMSAFVLEDGVVYHTYSTYARGLDGLWGAYQWLDRAPLGRNESGGIWWRRRDEYAAA